MKNITEFFVVGVDFPLPIPTPPLYWTSGHFWDTGRETAKRFYNEFAAEKEAMGLKDANPGTQGIYYIEKITVQRIEIK